MDICPGVNLPPSEMIQGPPPPHYPTTLNPPPPHHTPTTALTAGNPHQSFGTAPPPPTAEEVMNANPETSVTQPASANKLASFGKFWQGMTAGSQDEGSQPASRRTTVSCQAF